MATFTFTIRGDQIASYISLSGSGNGTGRVVTLSGVQTLGGPDDIYTITVQQAADTATQFTNGQFISITGPNNEVILPLTNVQPDAEQGLGAGDEHLIIPGAQLVIDVGGLTGGTMTYAFADEAATTSLGDNDGELDFADTRTTFPCFASGTLIRTARGDVPVETLVPGDLLMTRDAGAQPLVWMASRRLTLGGPSDRNRPVRIAPGALGHNVPRRALIVSPQHGLFIDGAAMGAPDDPGVLVAAKGLLGLRGVRAMQGAKAVTYHTLLMPAHQIIFAEGCAVESFYPGAYMMRHIGAPLRAVLHGLIPGLETEGADAYGPRVRAVMPVQKARRAARGWSFRPAPALALAG